MATSTGESDKYEVLERIGSGSFGVIRKVRRKSDGHILCRKEINYVKMSYKEREQLTTEFNILSSLRHPNIVAYYHREHLKMTQDLYLYMEYCGGGDLGQVINNLIATNQYAEEEFVWRVLSQLATALYRCHYGVDPPEPGSNVLGPSSPIKPSALKGKQTQVMILHRDLKPENIFLGEDQSVKLGDFGLSKMMGRQDFASTYVGTPFYMSPELCAGEKYTLYSDIWAVGCIMYQLCAKKPPFNEKSYMHLVQAIREAKPAPLPDIYSNELKSVIASCLRVNPERRPDTAALLNLPIIRLMRKDKEVTDLRKSLRAKEETLSQKAKELEQAYARLEQEKAAYKTETDNVLRREWEVRARLEIDRQVQMEIEKLRRQFESEVQARVAAELQKRRSASPPKGSAPATLPSQVSEDITQCADYNGPETDNPPVTDLSSLSLDSPASDEKKTVKKTTRTPFSRSKTTVDSPLDVQMTEPSPVSIDSLSLSPRRAGAGKTGRNIFAEGARKNIQWDSAPLCSDDEDDIPDLPSPTRPKIKSDPFKAPQRPLLRQNTTAMMQKLSTQPSLFPSAKTAAQPTQTTGAAASTEGRHTSTCGTSKSPSRRLSKIPSCTSLGEGGSPLRKGALKAPSSKASNSGDEMFKAVLQRNMGGRTLVELAQARAAGRVADDSKRATDSRMSNSGASSHSVPSTVKAIDRDPPATWDPEKDEMPSPFLNRGSKVIRNLR
ncbi:hypothetical protein VTO42DRAFT_7802 [Malbranchea cinnamomea]